MTRLPNRMESCSYFLNILSLRVADLAVVRVGLAMCGRRKDE